MLEITERSRLQAIESWEETLDRVTGLGFNIAVDDLGAGYSSLSVLADLQPRYIKMDMSIIHGVDEDPRKRRLVELLCRFADATDAMIVAEGVETYPQASTLRECGAHYLQGYYFDRPSQFERMQSSFCPLPMPINCLAQRRRMIHLIECGGVKKAALMQEKGRCLREQIVNFAGSSVFIRAMCSSNRRDIHGFDGVHLGHQTLLNRTIELARAQGALSVVYTFEPSPRRLLAPQLLTPRISSWDERRYSGCLSWE